MILIGIGSNLSSEEFGNPLDICQQAIKHLEKKFYILKKSSWYKSEPIPKSKQPWFVNGVIEIEFTNQNAQELLNQLNIIEKEFGRVRRKLNEPRILDLDIIDFNSQIYNKENLVLPHPRMHCRKFVLLPIKELNLNWTHPVTKKKINEMLNDLNDQQQITKI